MNFTLITGASAGIGKELAISFAKQKHNLVLVARRRSELESLASQLESSYQVKTIVYDVDLTEKEAISNLFNHLETNKIQLNMLINNAGFGLSGNFIDNDIEREVSMIELNVIALVRLSKAFIHHLKGSKGKLIQIASTAAFFPGPHMAIYYATKAFVMSFSKALRTELKRSNCSLSVVCPGPTRSEFEAVAGFNFDKIGSLAMTSEEVADYVVKKSSSNSVLIIPGFMNKLSVYSSFLTPNWLSDKIIGNLHK